MLQLLNIEGNRPRTEAYMGFKIGNTFFSYRTNCAAVEGLAGINGHRCKLVGEEGSVSCGGARTKGEGRDVISQLCVAFVSEEKTEDH